VESEQLARDESNRPNKRWIFLGRGLATLFVVCLFSNFLVDFWPNVPTSPIPESGNVDPVQIHGGYLYFTRTLLRLHYTLLIIAAACAAGCLLIRFRLRRDGGEPRRW
jgi:hypothetical protein